MGVRPNPNRQGTTKRSAEPDRRVRALLPSGRVAEFLVPRIGMIMSIQEDALYDAGIDPTNLVEAEGEAKGRAVVGGTMAITRRALRRLLVGLSERSVAPIYKPGFSLDAIQAKAE